MKKAKLISLLLGLTVTACSKQIPFPSTYVEKHADNVISFENTEYTFKTADEFEYSFFTDAVNYSKYGHGKYNIRGSRLQLSFSEELSDTIKSVVEGKQIFKTDSSRNVCQVHVKSFSGAPLGYVNVLIADSKNNILKHSVTDDNGNAEIILPNDSAPLSLKVSMIGLDNVTHEIDKNKSTRFEITIADRKLGSQIRGKQLTKRIKIRKNNLLIDGEEFVEKAP